MIRGGPTDQYDNSRKVVFSSTGLLPSGSAATPGEGLILLQKSWLMIPSKAYAFLHGKEVCKV
jgi:hypothetical protein